MQKICSNGKKWTWPDEEDKRPAVPKELLERYEEIRGLIRADFSAGQTVTVPQLREYAEKKRFTMNQLCAATNCPSGSLDGALAGRTVEKFYLYYGLILEEL